MKKGLVNLLGSAVIGIGALFGNYSKAEDLPLTYIPQTFEMVAGGEDSFPQLSSDIITFQNQGKIYAFFNTEQWGFELTPLGNASNPSLSGKELAYSEDNRVKILNLETFLNDMKARRDYEPQTNPADYLQEVLGFHKKEIYFYAGEELKELKMKGDNLVTLTKLGEQNTLYLYSKSQEIVYPITSTTEQIKCPVLNSTGVYWCQTKPKIPEAEGIDYDFDLYSFDLGTFSEKVIDANSLLSTDCCAASDDRVVYANNNHKSPCEIWTFGAIEDTSEKVLGYHRVGIYYPKTNGKQLTYKDTIGTCTHISVTPQRSLGDAYLSADLEYKDESGNILGKKVHTLYLNYHKANSIFIDPIAEENAKFFNEHFYLEGSFFSGTNREYHPEIYFDQNEMQVLMYMYEPYNIDTRTYAAPKIRMDYLALGLDADAMMQIYVSNLLRETNPDTSSEILLGDYNNDGKVDENDFKIMYGDKD